MTEKDIAWRFLNHIEDLRLHRLNLRAFSTNLASHRQASSRIDSALTTQWQELDMEWHRLKEQHNLLVSKLTTIIDKEIGS